MEIHLDGLQHFENVRTMRLSYGPHYVLHPVRLSVSPSVIFFLEDEKQ